MRGLWRQFWLDLLVMRHYLIAAGLVFAFSWIYGALITKPPVSLQGSLEGLRQITETLDATSNPQLAYFLFIFLNNAIKAILFVFFGALLGILPIWVLVTNGMLLGYVLANQEQSAWLVFAKGILPHGIIELPAIILACAYGIRFGFTLIKSLFMLTNEEKRQRASAEIVHYLWMTLPLMLLLTVSLLIAAVIESTITFRLMQ